MTTGNGIVHMNKCHRTGLEVREIQASAKVCPGEVFAAHFIMPISGNAALFFLHAESLSMFRLYYNQL